MKAAKLTLRDVAIIAIAIQRRHAEGAEMDEGVDAGEWSGPMRAASADAAILAVAERNGYTEEEVHYEMQRIVEES